MDTISGLAHFDEHMIFGGSERYVNYSTERTIGGLKGYVGSAYTAPTYQVYYILLIIILNLIMLLIYLQMPLDILYIIKML